MEEWICSPGTSHLSSDSRITILQQVCPCETCFYFQRLRLHFKGHLPPLDDLQVYCFTLQSRNVKFNISLILAVSDVRKQDILNENKPSIIRFVIPVLFIIKLEWSVCICLTQLYDGRDMYRIYYMKNNYMFRHFTLAIFMFRNEKT